MVLQIYFCNNLINIDFQGLMKKESSTENLGWVAIALSSAALLLAALAVCRSYRTVSAVTLDYLGVFASVLSLLVTALVAFEVYRAFSFDKSVRKTVKKRLREAECSASCLSLAQLGNALFNRINNKDYGDAIQTLFNALILSEKTRMSELGIEAKKNAIIILEKISDKLPLDTTTIKFESNWEQINKMKSIAYRIGSEKIIRLAECFRPYADSKK